MKLNPLATTALVVLSALAANCSARAGVLILDFSFQPTYVAGTDTAGMQGSTFTFNVSVDQATYSSYSDGDGGFVPYVPASAVSLTVAGSSVSANNGIWTPTSLSNPFAVVPQDQYGNAYTLVGYTGSGLAGVDFQFGSNASVVNFAPFSGSPVASPVAGGAVVASDFDGLVLNAREFTINGAYFEVPAGTVIHATMVPEPSTYAMMAGVGLLIFAGWRRRGAGAIRD